MPPQVIPLTTEQREDMRRREEEAARADIERMRREQQQAYVEGIRRKVKEIHDEEER